MRQREHHVFLYTDRAMKNQILIVKNTMNTGNYKWTVAGGITTHAKIGLISPSTEFSVSTNGFTISTK